MTATIQTQETLRITATAVSPAAELAIGSVASLLGIEPHRVAERRASVPTVPVDQVPGPGVRRVSAVLMLLGLRVRLDPGFFIGAGKVPCVAVALRPRTGADCADIALRVSARLRGTLPHGFGQSR